jgi:hypothetical protein
MGAFSRNICRKRSHCALTPITIGNFLTIPSGERESIMNSDDQQSPLGRKALPQSEKIDLDLLALYAIKDRQALFSDDAYNNSCKLIETYSALLWRFHKFAKLLTSNNESLFDIQETSDFALVAATDVGQYLLSLLSSDFHTYRREYPIHKFSPVTSIFFKYSSRFHTSDVVGFGVPLEINYARRLHTHLTELVKDLRSDLRKKETARATSNFRRSASKNFNKCIESLAALSDSGIECTALRFDIHYKSHPIDLPPKARFQIIQELHEIRKLRRLFHRRMKGIHDGKIVGWMCCLEYGPDRGWHYHYLVFLRGAHIDSVDLIERLRAEWSIITGGATSDNVNTRHHRRTATGIINFGHPDVIKGLQFIVAYFTLGDCFVQIDLSPDELELLGTEGIRTFMMGDFPEILPKHRNKGKGPMNGLMIRFSDALKRVKFV